MPKRLPEERIGRNCGRRVGASRIRSARAGAAVSAALDGLRRAAQGSDNVLPPMRAALKALATVGEVCGVLRETWGEYRPEVRL